MHTVIPKEPSHIKKHIKNMRVRLGGGVNLNYDSLAVWSFNLLPKYLWDNWKAYLKEKGVTWQMFLRILKLHTIDMIKWGLRDELDWKTLILRIQNSLSRYLK